MPKINLFTWIDSIILMALRYGETIEKITTTGRQSKINKVIANQTTDDEKRTIATLQGNHHLRL
jgi:hypothetical protein